MGKRFRSSKGYSHRLCTQVYTALRVVDVAQRKDYILVQGRDQLLQDIPDPSMQDAFTRHLLDDNGFLWHLSDDEKHTRALAKSYILVPGLVSLVLDMHGHPGIAATLILLR